MRRARTARRSVATFVERRALSGAAMPHRRRARTHSARARVFWRGVDMGAEPSSGDGFLSPLNLEDIVTKLRSARRSARQAGTQPVRTRDLPSPGAVDGIVQRLHATLFPRHRGAHDDVEAGVDYFVGHNLCEALRELQEQVRREIRFTVSQSDVSQSGVAVATSKIVASLAHELPRLYALLSSDIRAAYDGDPSAKSAEEVLLSFPGIKGIIHHRIAHELYRLGAPIIARIIAELAHSATGIDIHPGAQIGGNFFIDHGTGVVIGETAIIGERVRIYQAVTLGAKRLPADASGALVKGQPRHPIVEDDVVIYAGATVLGRVTIGRGSIIGGNVWLTHSVPAGSRIVQAEAGREVFEGGAGI
jgi:serine O-acetyltransferase